ncbi:hypothetical protein EJ05DRAFT_300990 [Pseudovirgaria hyperparasitica]|uniref:Uncharacterized protein n=1 Tax=Pseudovirgaria hyperparasitica TaxID=470096 RepID=A0A6A6WA08_9PEZI|nr:uncharacterized protein EJ05DRAFT_300990 [Pseudovirgaria hyperparasitica]KAF2759513.1 hypothetical protein EJ05DRAFT_300990 [Pseudovirgaria hyperparasitica]
MDGSAGARDIVRTARCIWLASRLGVGLSVLPLFIVIFRGKIGVLDREIALGLGLAEIWIFCFALGCGRGIGQSFRRVREQ